MTVVVKVIDALCGQGKTEKMIAQMAAMPEEQKIIYITPLLSETHRIAGTEYDPKDEKKRVIKNEDGLYVYKTSHPLVNKRFRHPESQQGDGKIGGLQYLIGQNQNIVATHALFQMLTPEIVQDIAARNYHLYMDEVLDVWNVWDEAEKGLRPNEVSALVNNEVLFLADDGVTLQFNHDRFGDTKKTTYEYLAALCDLSQLLYVSNTVLWQMPFDALSAFKSITIGTYLYEGSLLSAYLQYFGADVKIEHFGKSPSQIKHLVHLVEDEKLNAVGEEKNSLSYSKLTATGKPGTALREQLRKNLENLYKGNNSARPKSRQEERLWTVPKLAASKVAGSHYKASWLASTTKATNDYSERWYLAYLMEKNPKPPILTLLSKLGVSINKEKYALGEIVQWVWRSRIRNEQEIHLYMPSKVMRELFKEWLNDKHHFSTDNRPEFMPTTNPFKPNGELCKLWYDAALKEGVCDRETWEQFRIKYLDLAKQKGNELIATTITVPMMWN